VILPNPAGMDLQTWAQGVVGALGMYSGVITDTSDWQAWGMMFLQDPSLTALNPPNPYDYSDWVSWGQRLVDALSNASGAPTNSSGSAAPLPGGPTGYRRGIIAQNTNYIIAQNGNYLIAQP
jgi:hypothetical protein